MRRSLLLLLLLPIAACGGGEETSSPKPAPEPQGVALEEPVALASAEEGEFVAERRGQIYLIRDEQKELWADVSGRLGEEGLWGFALSPNWDIDRLFYVFFQNKGGATVLLEGSEEGEEGVPRRSVLRLSSAAGNLPGPIAFDGQNLLVGVRGQSGKLSGSVLRISPYISAGQAYTIPRGNLQEEEWLRGFRDINSIRSDGDLAWIVDEQGIWSTGGAKRKLEEAGQCLRGGIPEVSFVFGSACTGEIQNLRGDQLGRVPELLSLWPLRDEIAALSQSRFSVLGEEE